MALVKITKHLIERTTDQIKRIAQAQITQENLDDDRVRVSAQTIEELLWGSKRNLIQEIPSDWLRTTAHKSLIYVPPNLDDDDTKNGIYVAFQSTDERFALPPNMSPYGADRVSKDSLNYISDLSQLVLVKELLAKCDRKLEISKEWDDVATNVKKLLLTSKSLNEAVKLAPAIVTYLHPEDVERLDRKVERTAKTKDKTSESLDVDIESITASAVAYKMGV